MSQNGAQEESNPDDPDRRTAAPHGSTTAPHRDRREPSRPSATGGRPRRDPAPTRLIVQRGLFFGPSALVPEDLYSVVERGGARRERHRVVARPGTARSAPTPTSGRFHATYWQRWTAVGEVEVTARVSGTGRVRLMASDANKVWRIVAAEDVHDADGLGVRLVGQIDRFVDGGGLWLELDHRVRPADRRGRAVDASPRPGRSGRRPWSSAPTTASTTASTRWPRWPTTRRRCDVVDVGASWSTRAATRWSRAPGSPRSRRGSATGCATCASPTWAARAGSPAACSTPPPATRPTTRDVLLMDDDVLLRAGDPRAAHRVRRLHHAPDDRRRADAQPAAPRAPAHLRRVRRARDAAGRACRAGRARRGRTCSGSTSGSCRSMQDRRVDTEYNGWWSCLIPAAIVRAIGYPLPLFFQWDDIEFGYRARAHGFPTVALPGAGVWHADFGWKDWDEWHRYFNMRNGLITAALHSRFSMQRIGRTLGTLLGAVPGRHAVRAGGDADPGRRGLPRRPRGAATTARPRPRRRSGGSGRRTRRRVMRPMSRAVERRLPRAAGRPGRQRARHTSVLTWLKRVAYHLTDRAVHRVGHRARRATRTGGTCRRSGARSSPTCPSRACACAPGTGPGPGAGQARGQVAGAAGDRGPEGRGAVPGGDGPPDEPGELGAAVRVGYAELISRGGARRRGSGA